MHRFTPLLLSGLTLIGLLFAQYSYSAPPPPVENYAVGTLNGSISIDPGGGANYSIPITVPPGIGGMQPNLSLAYSSRSDNGIAGMGWSLGGLSVLHRCGKTWEQDNAYSSVYITKSDRLCLNGARLVAVSGEYGAAGTEYRTEVDTYEKIVQDDAGCGYACSFTVYSKAGQRSQYGTGLGSQQLLSGHDSPLSWSISRVSDTVGNAMSFEYAQDAADGSQRLTTVRYTEHSGLSAQGLVTFNYEARPDTSAGYLLGSPLRTTQRLANVAVSFAGVPVRSYSVLYQQGVANGLSFVDQIKECIAPGSPDEECFVPTHFSWLDTPASTTDWGVWANSTLAESPFVSLELCQGLVQGDVNGDGRSDIICAYANPYVKRKTYVRLSTGSSYTGWQEWFSGPADGLDLKTCSGYQAADFNGDGLTDLACMERSGLPIFPGTFALQIHVQLARTNNSFSDWQTWGARKTNPAEDTCYVVDVAPSTIAATFKVGDINGDGYSDIICPSQRGSSTYMNVLVSTGSSFIGWSDWGEAPGVVKAGCNTLSRDGFYVGDANGDGRTDIICSYDDIANGLAKAYVWLSEGDKFNVQRWDDGTSTEALGQNCSNEISADVNGDGLTDLICPYLLDFAQWQIKVRLSTGSSYLPWDKLRGFSNTSLDMRSCRQLIPADIDNDGHQDLVCPYDNGNGTTTTFVMRSINGEGFSAWESLGNESASTNLKNCRTLLGGDADGDGQLDLICPYDAEPLVTQVRVQSFTGGARIGLLDLVSSSAGPGAKIYYKPLTDNSVYTPEALDACPGYPTVCSQSPLYVVSKISSNNGIGGISTIAYHYASSRLNVRGRGWLGFGEVTVTNGPTVGISATTRYNQDFSEDTDLNNPARKAKYAKNGVPDKAETKEAGGILIGRTTSTWVVQTYNDNTHFDLLPETTTEEAYGLTGTELITTVLTQNSDYDAYGNPARVSITTTGGGETFTKVTDSRFSNDTANWFLGRLTQSTVTSTSPNSSLARTAAFEYDATTGLLTAEIVEPGDPNLEVRTEYSYANADGNNYGIQTAVTIKGADGASYPFTAQTSTTAYDFSNLANGQYTVIAANALGHTETQLVDARFGATLQLTGPNGLTATWSYDSFGRVVTENRVDGTRTTTTEAWCDASCSKLAKRIRTTTTTAAPPVIQYIDPLGRTIRSETTGFTGKTIVTKTVYNYRGDIDRVSRNHFSGDSSYWTRTKYDSLGRVREVASPDGGVVTTVYNGLDTTIIRSDRDGVYPDQTITQTQNAIGQEIRVVDAAGVLQKTYDAFGSLEAVVAYAASGGFITTQFTYDRRGRKIAMDDPDMGRMVYAYDALERLREQTDNKGQKVVLTYDQLGRVLSRTEAEGTTTWAYDTAVHGIGAIAEITGPGGYKQTLAYDNLGRPRADVRQLNGNGYTTAISYDAVGRVERQTYPSGFEVQYAYNTDGFLYKAFNAANSNDIFWEATETDADGNTTLFELAGGTLQTVRLYQPFNGQLASISTNNGIQFLEYGFDSLGNLRSRASKSDPQNSLTETFAYDDINRLTSSTISGFGIKTYAYDALGNITQKGTVTDYAYGESGAGPHAVTTADSQTYSYDANGNMISGAGRTLKWTSYNKPRLITRNSATVAFVYGPNRARYKQTKVANGTTSTTIYFDKLYEEITKNNLTEKKHYISVGGSTIAIYNHFSDGNENIRYLHTDHLGSTDVVTDELGQVIERHSFDAFGARRNVDWSDPTGLLSSVETTRGFTGHEQLDDVGLVHMNGRVYDPVLGRFISADPQIQFPSNLQSFNRYTYVHNNPLSYTDPSGFGIFSKIRKGIKRVGRGIKRLAKNQWVRLAVGTALAFVAGPAAYAYTGILTGSTVAAAAAGGFVGGFLIGATTSGSLKGGLIGGLQGAAFAFVGHAAFLQTINDFAGGLGAIGLHGAVGGAFNRVQGGNFKDGFLGGIATKFVNLNLRVNPNNAVLGTVRSMLAGGLGTAAGGGKFINGARTAAFSYLFNDAGDRFSKPDPAPPVPYAWGVTYERAEQAAEIVSFAVPAEKAVGFFGWAARLLGLDRAVVTKSGGGLFKVGKTPKASELKKFAEQQGFKPSQSANGPLKFVDKNGVNRITIKQGSSRAPGSSNPHVELRNASGQRVDPAGNPVTRKSPGNHTPIDFDL